MRLEEQQHLATGEVTLILYKFDEQGNEQQLKKETFRNMIVRKASELMARRMAPGGNHIANGFQYLALGTGVGNGTVQAPQASEPAMTQLRTELFRKAITSFRFVDMNNTTPTDPTNILELTTEIAENESVGALTEMGLFGGDAQAGNPGYMFNHKVFPVWNKPNDARMKIIWKITF